MKKWMAMVMCALMLLCTQSALAAPARDTQRMDLEVSSALQAEIDRAAGEAAGSEAKVHVYITSVTEDNIWLYGDVYACDVEGEGPVALLPEEAVTWLHSCKISLEKDLDSEAGYRVKRVESLSPQYKAGKTSLWETADNTEYGYSLLLPTGFVLKEDVARHMVWQMEGGEETLSVDAFENTGYAALLADYMQAPTGEVLLENEEIGYFSTFGDTFYEMYVAVDGTDYGYILRLDFPQERQEEYLFYGELIRNAFFVWGGAVG